MKIQKLRKIIIYMRKKVRPVIAYRLWIIHGTERHSGEKLGIIYAGNPQRKNYIKDLAYNSNYVESDEGTKYLWDIFRMIRKNEHNCSMMIINCEKFLRKLIKGRKDYYIPNSVYGEVDIPLCFSCKSAKEDRRKIRKSNLKYEVTIKRADFHDFYYKMYLPYVTQRHGNKLVALEYDHVMELRKLGMCRLLFVKRKCEYIAGQVILFDKKGPSLLMLGVKDGNPSYFRDGVSGACYYFASLYLKELGYSMMNLGGSKAFLKDGVLQFKKKWGLSLVGTGEEGYLIKPLAGSKGLREFFFRNPFIYIDRGKLCGAVFIENDKGSLNKSLQDIYKRFYINGISNMNIYQFKEEASTAVMAVGPPLSANNSIF